MYIYIYDIYMILYGFTWIHTDLHGYFLPGLMALMDKIRWKDPKSEPDRFWSANVAKPIVIHPPLAQL